MTEERDSATHVEGDIAEVQTLVWGSWAPVLSGSRRPGPTSPGQGAATLHRKRFAAAKPVQARARQAGRSL